VTRAERVLDLMRQRDVIERELDTIRVELKAEKAAFNVNRKPRKPKEAELPLKPVPTPAPAKAAPVKK
jgi:hypothetical protein